MSSRDRGQPHIAIDGVKVTPDAVKAAAKNGASTDVDYLRALAGQIDRTKEILDTLITERDTVAGRLRNKGLPMTAIANYAGVSDSLLARRILAGGGKRRSDRTWKGHE